MSFFKKKEKQSCFDCKWFEYKCEQWETRPSAAVCNFDGTILASGGKILDGHPEVPGWCTNREEKLL